MKELGVFWGDWSEALLQFRLDISEYVESLVDELQSRCLGTKILLIRSRQRIRYEQRKVEKSN